MKHFKISKFTLLIIAAEIIFSVYGCGKISQGLQRRKFEYLYRMSSDVTLIKEYTAGIQKIDDLDFYETKLSKLYLSTLKMEPVEEYGESRTLKEDLLSLIDRNIELINELKKKKFTDEELINNEFEVIQMRENVSKFNEELNKEIIRVGKE